METSAMLQLLKDPMGVPFYPVVFQALMVLTFALHILFVNLSLGTTCLVALGRLKGGERWGRLAGGMAQAATASVSGAILLGVAPLLFVQVIYDPFWYASSNLSAAWAIGFIFVLMAGYGSLWTYFRSCIGREPCHESSEYCFTRAQPESRPAMVAKRQSNARQRLTR